MAFSLTNDQARALDDIRVFQRDPDKKLFSLSGAAGTGKTTILKQVLNADTIVGAPTNKANNVLRGKGFPNATTLDRILNKSVYSPIRRELTPEEVQYHTDNDMELPSYIEEEFYEKVPRNGDGITVCIDESSMMNQSQLDRLLGMYSKVVCVGDGFQLPPVEGERWFQTIEYDVVLKEIVRTAAESEITQIANLIRMRNPEWKKRNWNSEVTIVNRRQTDFLDHLSSADAVLAFTNATCDVMNFEIRDLKALMDERDNYRPSKGDNVLSWVTVKDKRLIKSEVYEIVKCGEAIGGCYIARLKGISDMIRLKRASLMQQQTKIETDKSRQILHFSYAHCITGHKSQGSEWDSVVVLAYDKSSRHEDYWNWLYTACTRAKKHLTVVT